MLLMAIRPVPALAVGGDVYFCGKGTIIFNKGSEDEHVLLETARDGLDVIFPKRKDVPRVLALRYNYKTRALTLNGKRCILHSSQ